MPSLLKILTDPQDFKFYNSTFEQKNLPYNSIAAGGNNAQPYIVKPIPTDQEVPTNTPDFLFRGGTLRRFNAVKDDIQRLTKFFASPQGVNFAIKQNIASTIYQVIVTGPQGSVRYNSIPIEEIFSRIENNIYSPISTYAQIAAGGTGVLHVDRSLFGEKSKTYSSINNLALPKPVGQSYPLLRTTPESSLQQKVNNTDKLQDLYKVIELNKDLQQTTKKNRYSVTGSYKVKDKLRRETYSLSESGSLTDIIAISGIISGSDSDSLGELQKADLIEFSIQAINNDTPSLTDYIFFRAYLDSLTDSFNSTWDPYKFIGRGENFHSYTGFTRGISLNFKIYCGENQEYIDPTYKKLNYLASLMTPDYSKIGYPRGNLIKLTIGNYVKNLPGILTGLVFSLPVDYGWDIENTKVPNTIDVTSFNFTPIHTQLPKKSGRFMGEFNQNGT